MLFTMFDVTVGELVVYLCIFELYMMLFTMVDVTVAELVIYLYMFETYSNPK